MGSPNWEDLQQNPEGEVCLGHRYDRWGLRVLTSLARQGFCEKEQCGLGKMDKLSLTCPHTEEEASSLNKPTSLQKDRPGDIIRESWASCPMDNLFKNISDIKILAVWFVLNFVFIFKRASGWEFVSILPGKFSFAAMFGFSQLLYAKSDYIGAFLQLGFCNNFYILIETNS